MADQQQQDNQESTQDATSGGSGGTAMKAAAAAAATGVAALAARKALSRGQGNGGAKNGGSPGSGGESIFSSMLSGGWEAARDSLVPVAEDAAAAAGQFLAQHAPDVVRDRIVPRFISSFNEATEGS